MLAFERFHLQSGETDRPAALGTTADETGPFPPGPDQRLIGLFLVATRADPEIDPFHSVIAVRMRALGVGIVDVW